MYLNVTSIGNNICERYIGDDGTEHRRRVPYEPCLFVHTTKETGFTDIYGKNCLPKRFDSMSAARKYKRDNEEYHEILGMEDFVVSYISDNYKVRTPNINQIRIANVDIEVPAPEFPNAKQARYEIKTIVHYDSIDDKYYFFAIPSNSSWDRSNSVVPANVLAKVVYIECQTEKQLLTEYLLFWRKQCPNIVTGWNIEYFDMPYIGRRIEQVLGQTALSALSPWNKVSFISSRDNEDEIKLSIEGVEELDYLALYKKFTFTPRPNYRLDYIGEVEVGANKLTFDQDNYLDFYKQDFQRFGDYNIIDVDLVNRIDKKLFLLQVAVSLAYYAGINFSTVFGTLKPWDAIIFNSLRTKNKVVPMARRNIKNHYIGAFVKDPIAALYRLLASFDLTSLYPSIIRQVNISPECIIGQIPTEYTIEDQIDKLANREFKFDFDVVGNYSASANGMLYTKEFKGVIPTEIEKVFFGRKDAKKKMIAAQKAAEEAKLKGDMTEYENQKSLEVQYNIEQMVLKIQINALYGALGNEHFRYFNEKNAEAVTSFGQLAIKWVARDVNKFLNHACGTNGVDYVVYGDTDSIYLTFEALIKKLGKDNLPDNEMIDYMDKIGRMIEDKVINPSYDLLTEYMNNSEKQMFMDREALALKGFFLAKKRYALSVSDMEGVRYSEPKLKIMGIETQRSSTPPLAQQGLKECIKRILQQDEGSLQEYVKEFKQKWMDAEYDRISYVSSANNLAQHSDASGYPVKGCPGHIKGALAYNRYAIQNGFDLIKEGERIALVKLKEPNRYGVPVMAYPSGASLPPQIDPVYFKACIDYNLLYEDKFLSPLKSICEAIGWNYEKTFNLSSFFS